MSECVFLGWDEPLLGKLVDWLWERRAGMPGMTVVVPTAQSGRRLREALAERGACLAPAVVTPGFFLRTEEAAPPAMEVLAWVEALEGVKDWSAYQDAFPLAPGDGERPGWALALGRSLVALERSLQEKGLGIPAAVRILAQSSEAGRWADLNALAELKKRIMKQWGARERSRLIEARAKAEAPGRVVLAGVAELPGVVAEMLSRSEVVALVAAPEEERDRFDALGQPLMERWKDRAMDWPEKGTVTLAADPRQQALEAVRRVAEAGTGSDDLALGSADGETAGELERAFGRAGWVAYNSAGRTVSPATAWWSAWRAFLLRPDAATAIDLLGFSETSALVGGKRAQRVRALSLARDQWLARDREDLARMERISKRDADSLKLARESLQTLEAWRSGFQRRAFPGAMESLLERVDGRGAMSGVREWVRAMEETLGRVDRDAGFWLDLMIGDLPGEGVNPPGERVVDIQGWLELLHEPGRHLLVCGMNEGKVPATGGTDPWLPEGARRMLGLITDESRAARDAYMLRAMLEARRSQGRVDLLLGKFGADGDALLPSRLLLAAPDVELARRVGVLFRELEPPDAGIAWSADWKWSPPAREVKPRMSVTALRDYLACPLRFYLKHVVGMRRGDPERVEWDAREFGNVVHAVLERWGLDEEAREFSKHESVKEWVHAELNKVVAERFGDRPPLAVRIQTDRLRQRLSWFAIKQASLVEQGWHVDAVEEKFEIERQGIVLVGKIDRIDRHEDGRRRVLDYKTYAVLKKVETDHRSAVTAASRLPAHLENVPEVLCEGAKGKALRWTNLQVPLYSAALGDADELGYFVLGATATATDLSLWKGFEPADQESALACADWILREVAAGVFGPAAEKVTYDDFAALAMGRSLEDLIEMGASS